jgi:hypothetical protein
MENMVIYWKNMGYFGVSIPFDNPTAEHGTSGACGPCCLHMLDQVATQHSRCAVLHGVAGERWEKCGWSLTATFFSGRVMEHHVEHTWHSFDVCSTCFNVGWDDRPTIHQLIYIITQSSKYVKYAQSQTLSYSSRCSFWNSVQYPSSSSLFSKCKSLCPSYKVV